MGFFFISATYLSGSRQATMKEIREVVLRKNLAEGQQITLDRTRFKLANLDTLMMSNDKLLKLQNNAQSFLKKIDKQFLDLQQKVFHQWLLEIDDRKMTIPKYLYSFKWNESKYPRSYPIPRIVETFQVKLGNIENQLRGKLHYYNETKAQLNQQTQKQGNYYVKDLTDLLVEPIVKAKDFHDTRFVKTLVVIVPITLNEEFQNNYQSFTNNVIPNSAKKLSIPEKQGLNIWTVDIFNQKINVEERRSNQDPFDEDRQEKDKVLGKKEKKNLTPVQQFIQKSRQKMKVMTKQFKFEPGLSNTRKKKREQLTKKLASQTKAVSDICLACFTQIYEMYVHAKILRLIIETNMRFGNDHTVIYLIQCCNGKQKNVQVLLVDIFGGKENEGLYGTKDEIDDGEDFFPFIYVPTLTL